jgi:3-oxoadipate enol-lactonase
VDGSTGKTAFATAPDGVRIAYRADGPSDRPAVLLCTMASANLTVWDGLAAALSADWRVIRHDRRGDGASDCGLEESHTFATYVSDALLVMDRVGAAKAVVCGMAFGARVALHIARDAPARTIGLALFDATGGAPAPGPERVAGQEWAARLRLAADLPEHRPARAWFSRPDRSPARFGGHALKGQPAWTSGLSAIAVPTLIACGDQDPNLPGSIRLADEIPGARFTSMPMTGHGSILERPDLVLALLREFLEVAPFTTPQPVHEAR